LNFDLKWLNEKDLGEFTLSHDNYNFDTAAQLMGTLISTTQTLTRYLCSSTLATANDSIANETNSFADNLFWNIGSSTTIVT